MESTIFDYILQFIIGIALVVVGVKLSLKLPSQKKKAGGSTKDYCINGELMDEGEYFSRQMEKED